MKLEMFKKMVAFIEEYFSKSDKEEILSNIYDIEDFDYSTIKDFNFIDINRENDSYLIIDNEEKSITSMDTETLFKTLILEDQDYLFELFDNLSTLQKTLLFERLALLKNNFYSYFEDIENIKIHLFSIALENYREENENLLFVDITNIINDFVYIVLN